MSDRPTLGRDATPSDVRRPLFGVALVLCGLGVLAIAIAVLIAVSRSTGDRGSDTPGAEASGPIDADSSADEPTTTLMGSTTPTTAIPTAVPATASPTAPALLQEIDIRPIGAVTDSTLPSQRGCDGQVSSYGAANAIDGDPQTAWASAEDDGAGRHLTVDLGRDVDVTQVGIIPGYAKVGPLRWNGCRPVSRFELNRQIVRVRYRFDDGSSVEQSFSAQPSLQWTPVGTTTRLLEVEILETRLPAGAHVDDDTLISELGVRGHGR